MRRSVHVRIHTYGYASSHAAAARDGVEQFKLRFGFAVEAEDTAREGVLDLLGCFTNARENYLARVPSSFENPKQLAAGYDVETRPGFGEQLQQCQVGVSFHGIANRMRNI